MRLLIKSIKFLLICFLLSFYRCSIDNIAPDQVKLKWTLGEKYCTHSEVIEVNQKFRCILNIDNDTACSLCENRGIEISIKIDDEEYTFDTIKIFPKKHEFSFERYTNVSLITSVVPIDSPIVCKRLGNVNCELIIEN